jgi:hypothetical protein
MKVKLHKASKDLSRQNEVLLVLGDGDSMLRDMEEFCSWDIPHDVGALGRGIKVYPGYVRHWFNADGETAIHWVKNLINGNGTITHTLGPVEGFDVDWDMEQPDYHFPEITNQKDRIHGSSALFATLAGLYLGYSKVVLAGCPLDQNGHYYFDKKDKDTLGPLWLGMDFMAWLDFTEQTEASRVRSMSGYTAKILGQADREWIIA